MVFPIIAVLRGGGGDGADGKGDRRADGVSKGNEEYELPEFE